MELVPQSQADSPDTGLSEQQSPKPELTKHTQDRIHYLDNLRALAMLLGVLLHAGLAYADPAQQLWLATDKYSSRVMDCAIWLVHLFRMALFFLIAGYFGKLVMARKGTKYFVKQRTLRLLLPFILFLPLLLAAMGAIISFGVSYIEQPQGIMKWIRAVTDNPEWAQAQPARETLKTMHLWFLYYLILFSLLAVILQHRLRWLPWEGLFRRPWLVALTPLLLVPAAMAGGTPMAAPDSLIPTWWPFAFYGLYFLFGWQLFGREAILDRLQSWWLPMCLFVGITYVGYYRLMPWLAIAPPSGASWIARALMTAYLSAVLVALALATGRRFLASRNAVMRWIADASYWTYLIHLPVVIFMQILLVEADVHVWVKFSSVVVSTLAICGVSYLLFVRYTPIGWLLNGKRATS